MYREATTETCKRGHLLTPDNVRLTAEGWRVCRQCAREQSRREKRIKAERNRRAKQLQFVGGLSSEALAQEFGIVVPADATPEHKDWIDRRLRERAGLSIQDDLQMQQTEAMVETSIMPHSLLGPQFIAEE